MKKFVIGGAAVLATAGVGLGLAQLANADSASPEPTDSSSVSVATEQAAGQQGDPMNGQHGGPLEPRDIDTSALAQKLGVEESKLAEAFQNIQQPQSPGGAPGQAPGQNDESSQPPAAPPGGSEAGDRDTEIAKTLAQTLGLDESTVTTAIQEVRSDANQKVLDQAVSDGKLTQEEADAVTKAAAAGIAEVRGAGSRPR